jgi:predicted amidohydrolase
MRLAIVQMAVRDGDVAENLTHAVKALSAAPAAAVYLLPELWTTGYAYASFDAAADRAPEVVGELQRLARRRGGAIAGSLVSRRGDGRLVNRLWFCPPDGSAPLHYDKGHLIPALAEPEHFVRGAERRAVDVAGSRAALSICFDLRFPEMYRRDAVDGAELFLIASAWPEPRCDAMSLFARARAAENQAWLAVCNRPGDGSGGMRFCGGSLVVDPLGNIVAQGGGDEQIICADIDPGTARALRRDFPVLTLRSPTLDG